MSIKSITTNVKSKDGSNYTVELGEKTLLIGPNESGKSSIVEAIQLACHGQVHGLLMRSGQVKSSTQLATLIPEGEDRLFAEVELTDGNTCSWEMLSGKRPCSSGSANHLTMPMAQLKSMLSGSPDKIVEFFFEHLVGLVSLKEFDLNISPGILYSKDHFETLLPDLGTGEEVKGSAYKIHAADLIDMLADAKKLQRDGKSQAKALDSTLKHLGRAAPVSDVDIRPLWEDLFKALKIRLGNDILKGCNDFTPAQVFGSIGTAKELKSLKGSAELVDDISEMLESKATYDLACRIRDQTTESLKESNSMSQVAKAIQSGIWNTTSAYLQAYSDRVSTNLPAGDVFEAKIEDGKFTFGLKRGELLHQAMSGSTETRVLAAMASALLKPKEEVVLILDDRMWDANTLSRTMASLESSPAQVVIMSTLKPRGRKRGGWTYVEVGSTAHEEEDAE